MFKKNSLFLVRSEKYIQCKCIWLKLALLLVFFPFLNCASSMIKAVQAGDKEMIQKVLDDGGDINEYKFFYYTPIINAVIDKNKEIVEFLIKKGADPNGRGSGNTGKNRLVSTVYIAASLGDEEMVKLLLSNGADPNIRTEYAWMRTEFPYVTFREKGHPLRTIVETLKAYEDVLDNINTREENKPKIKESYESYKISSSKIAEMLLSDKRVLSDSAVFADVFPLYLGYGDDKITDKIFKSLPPNAISNEVFKVTINLKRSDYLQLLLTKG